VCASNLSAELAIIVAQRPLIDHHVAYLEDLAVIIKVGRMITYSIITSCPLAVSFLLSFFMPVDRPSNVYRVQLSSLYHGYALWNPSPVKNIYNQVSIGDVGYVNSTGFFFRMFNVTLPWDDPSNNRLGKPVPYVPLDCGEFVNSHETPFYKGDYCTLNISSEKNVKNQDPHE
jgi:hypothetical protein